jgi:RNA 3'-terminal phosphate cyclase
VSIIAESTTECLISTDCIYKTSSISDPEKLGESAALNLLDEITYSGCIDLKILPTVIILMGLSSSENASDVKVHGKKHLDF